MFTLISLGSFGPILRGSNRTPGSSGRWLAHGLWLAGCFLIGAIGQVAEVGKACETPVYRYAMYRWQPAPYEVYYLHSGTASGQQPAIQATIEELSEATENRANFVYLPVDLEKDPKLLSVPPDVKQAWQAHGDKQLPSYLVATPYGQQLFVGSLDESAIRAMAESPARKSLAMQLEAGKVGVFLLVSGQEEAQNEQARDIVQEVMADVAGGKVSLYTPPVEPSAAEEEEHQPPQFELGLIEVARDNEQEAWLVKSLLAMEPDLREEKAPMVFLVYGRARALLPYIGPGISRENLLQEVEFISGACSCTVKEQNPGVDLLVRYDWEAAAAAVADRVGTEEGNESMSADMFFPELLIPSANETTSADQVSPKDENPAEDNPADVVAAADLAGESALEPPPDDPADAPAVARASAAETNTDVASVPRVETTTLTDDPIEPAGGFSLFATVGGGLVVALVVLFGITLIVLRPQ